MSGYDPPALGQANPGLTLAAACDTTGSEAREFERYFSEVVTKGENVEPVDGAREVGRRAAFAESGDFFYAVEVLGGPEANRMGRSPEHGDQRRNVVGNEGGFVSGIELGQLFDDGGIVDEHQKRRLSGRMFFAMDALTVIMGSLTTWLRRRCMATLQRM